MRNILYAIPVDFVTKDIIQVDADSEEEAIDKLCNILDKEQKYLSCDNYKIKEFEIKEVV